MSNEITTTSSLLFSVPINRIIKEIKKVMEANNYEQLNLYLDMQNMTVKSYLNNPAFFYIDLVSESKKELKNLILFLSHILEQLKPYKVKIFLYWDKYRNLFNENLIPGWKEQRLKSLSGLSRQRPELWLSQKINLNLIYTVLDLFIILSRYFDKVKAVKLRYMDSDIVPALAEELEAMEFSNHCSLIISSDNDYIHYLNQNHIFRFPVIKKQRHYKGIMADLIEGKTDIVHYLYYKYKLKDKAEAEYLLAHYPIIHALAGDKSDFQPLLKGKGLKYWLKTLKNLYPDGYDFPARLVRDPDGILADLQLPEDTSLLSSLIKRYILTDHFFQAKIILYEENRRPLNQHLQYTDFKIMDENRRIFRRAYEATRIETLPREDFKELCLWLALEDKETIKKVYKIFYL